LSWVIKAVFTGFVALRREKYDVLLSRAAPQYGHLPALIVSRITGIPWIANWSDPMPPQKSPPPYGSGVNAKVSFFLNMYGRTVFRYADWHTFPCERLMKYYWKMSPELEGKSSVIPHIALRKFCISQNQEKNVFSLCHTGSIALRDPSVFFEGVKRFLKEYKPTKEVKVIFIGDSADEIRAKALASGVGDIIWIEAPRTYEETQSRAASSSVLLAIEAKCEEGIFFPSKFVDFIQTGRPVLAVSPQVGTLSDILSKNGGGIAVDNRSAVDIANALTLLYREWINGDISERYGSEKMLNLFSEEYVLQKLFEILAQLRKFHID
jgi:glycosyltransferase involved in cell wall biosynthesis